MRFGSNGVLLADVPGSGVARADTNTTSGNPNHDTRSGKFGAGGGSGNRSTPPANTDPHEYGRMLDAVREAARTIEDPNDKNIKSFVDARAAAPDQVDIAQFLQAVRDQRISDMIDMLDQQLRGTRHTVRLVASAVYMKRILRALTPEEVATISHRLQAMGHDAKQIDRYFADKDISSSDDQQIAASDSDPIGMAPAGWIELSDDAPAEDATALPA
jgi:hypothetical protein